MIRLCAINDEVSNSFENCLNILKNNNIEYVEVRKIDDKMFDELSENEQINAIELLNKFNIKVAVLDSSIGKKIVDDKVIFNEYISLAIKLKAKAIRVFSDLSNEYLKYINEKSKQSSIELYMENEPNTMFESFEYFYEIKERLNLDNIYICYDNENYYRCNNIKIEKELLDVKHIHLRDYADDYTYILEGKLEIGKILNKINEINYDGLVSVESHLPMVMNLGKEDMFNRCVNNIKKTS